MSGSQCDRARPGLKDDRTVITVCHAERRHTGGPLVVLGRIAVPHGSRANPVQLSDIEALVKQTSATCGHARVRLDPWQAVGLAQRLRDHGVDVEEWSLTSTPVGRLGATLHTLLRDHRLALPNDDEVLAEFGTVRLRESAPGVYRLDHDSGQHDDRAVSLGVAALALVERTGSDWGGATSASQIAARITRLGGRPRALSGANPYAAARTRGTGAAVAAAQRAQSPAQRAAGLGLIVPGSANDLN